MNSNEVIEKLNKVAAAWRTHAPKKSLAGMTVAQFEQKVKSSFDVRTRITEIESQRTGALSDRNDLDKANLSLVKLVVNAVRGDPAAGDDSTLYESMGYVRASERKSGLKRPRKPRAPSA